MTPLQCRPAALAPTGNLLEMQNPRLHPTPTESEYVCQDPQGIPIYIKSLRVLSYTVGIQKEVDFVCCSLVAVKIP